MISKKRLNDRDRKRLDDILAKAKGSPLSESDVVFLTARRAYLSDKEKKLIKGKKSPGDLSYKAMQKRASELGLKSVGVKKADLEASIIEAENKLTNPIE